jgi:hypothetical protein
MKKFALLAAGAGLALLIGPAGTATADDGSGEAPRRRC